MSELYLNEYRELAPYSDDYNKTLGTLDLEDYRTCFLQSLAFARSPKMIKAGDDLTAGGAAGKRVQAAIARLASEQVTHLSLPVGPMDPKRPGGLYPTMLQTIVPYAARGVIWYQGESDEVLPGQYALLFTQMVRCWRDTWGTELPFLTVQLAPFRQWLSSTGEHYPELRRQQEIASKTIPRLWMASIMDAGEEDDIHPKRKLPVGERLALLARGKVYDEYTLLCEPPEAAEAEWAADRVRVLFSHTGDGLRCAGSVPAGLRLVLDGEETDYRAEIKGDSLILYSDKIGPAQRAQILYAWRDYVQADLYNSAGLCAKPFCFER